MNRFIIIVLVLVVFGCAKTKNEEQPIASEATGEGVVQNLVEKSYHTVDSTQTIIQDTLFSESSFRVVISNVPSDTYVTQTYSDDQKTKTDYYQDIDKQVAVFQNDVQLVDTIFSKSGFDTHVDKEFILNSIFKNYWIDSYNSEKNEIKFFGTLTKPETDWTFAFYHVFSIAENKFTVEPYIEERI